MAYDENSMIRVGDAVLPIKEVSALYLLDWYNSHKDGHWQGHKRKLLEWVEKNMDELKRKIYLQEIEIIEKERQSIFLKNKLTCNKKPYIDKKVANAELNRISQLKSEGKIPVRSYKCDKCSFWHLTSKPLTNYNPL